MTKIIAFLREDEKCLQNSFKKSVDEFIKV